MFAKEIEDDEQIPDLQADVGVDNIAQPAPNIDNDNRKLLMTNTTLWPETIF